MSALEKYLKFRAFLAYLILAGIIVGAMIGRVKTAPIEVGQDWQEVVKETSCEPDPLVCRDDPDYDLCYASPPPPPELSWQDRMPTPIWSWSPG